MAGRKEEQSFDKGGAAAQFSSNYELDVFIEVHMDDLHGTGPRPALEQIQAKLSPKILFKIWTVNEVGTRYEHLMRDRLLHNERTEIMANAQHLRADESQHQRQCRV